ncbi:HigA family addiction module antitoxin [Roseomonas indoligenes]|uniref:HigA family addiction module antidote protein n=1 Tax=Roseomonas indoligenes TaxID=2820811 RepID=A0A940S812_9PROT|nr:HigA family addiction module antitoxin [Pararoseomonas indoligenes]MBP0493632.1 HigA family addiction module antidote protein [Pararoseomonas indoligenes]
MLPKLAFLPPSHPGVLLAEFLRQADVSRADFACAIRVCLVRLDQIVDGQRSVTAEMALRLAKATGIGAETWLAAQQQWDLYDTEDLICDELAKIQPVSRGRVRLAA